MHIAPLDSSFYYAFNFDEPSGVKLLKGALAERLLFLKRDSRPVPEIGSYLTHSDRVLAIHKLLLVRSDPQTYHSRPSSAEKSFNVWLHVINGCNLKCFYCYIPQLESHINPAVINSYSLSNETAHCMIDRLLAFCRNNAFTHLRIKFAGGEPTLNIPVVEHFCRSIVEAAGDLRVSFGMISNGTFAVSDVQPLLTRYNISLSISVDGFESHHDKVRFSISGGQRMGTWSTIEQNITALMNFGIMPYLLYTVTKLNATSLHQFAEWAHSRKLGFRLSPVRLRRTSLESEIDEISSRISSLYSWLGGSMPTSLMFERDARFAEWNLKKKKLTACGSCRNYLALTETGEIRPCQMSAESPFNIINNTIDEAMSGFSNHTNTATLADPSQKKGACKECQYYHVCSGGCPQHTLSVHGASDHPSPWCRLYGETAHIYIKAKAMHLRRQLALIEENALPTVSSS